MKLGTVAHEGVEKPVAVIDDDTLLDLRAAGLDIRDMVQLVEMGEAGLEAVRDALANPQFGATLGMTDVEMRVPIRPVQYRDCLVFETHLKNCFVAMEKVTGRSHEIPPVWYDQPIYYKGNRLSFIGDGQDVRWPNYAEFLDLELELAIIIGKRGTDIPANEAPGYIWGYTILNDMTARDAQMVEMAGQLGPAKGKDFDTGNILGPWIVTADEIGHPAALDMEVRVNGTRWGGGNSAQMHHSFADIIAHISRSETLYPGEVIGSGTVGTGCGLELGKRLEPGDRFELEVEKIGVLRNRIVR
ncbi:fumarylacetoacetate hydrolase family protein [Lutimaribacter saemankumensis]|uniref:2-keto-4-pentenoate hydratase/2-oxohepta-3-ene-1,7-dioic acid hydratase (Catechol pathway) n=1 Tax=Lutimaribacter saemankumensis TaxID=490829 RepID=A0A1G8QUQ3_9RHOB|nr:fumarylacetoacetate hydrolase family protein [Lutimaribacter saemankumensis]SDJ08436.1 2-keto-4-pentenoate hydratase/2-oxohepta-3-ene-1,7-dioic acid hydratase (catechol pathway) [Lutimaribacter saemankumensis]